MRESFVESRLFDLLSILRDNAYPKIRYIVLALQSADVDVSVVINILIMEYITSNCLLNNILKTVMNLLIKYM